MINTAHIKKILEINGVASTAPEANIRSVLLSARYQKDEIDTAILVLREDEQSKEIKVEGLHKVFRTNDTLSPKEISQLLGIEVDASSFVQAPQPNGNPSRVQFFAVWFLSIVFAATGMLVFMHMNHIGPFHPSMA